MKRIIFSLVLICLLLCACGEKPTTEPTPPLQTEQVQAPTPEPRSGFVAEGQGYVYYVNGNAQVYPPGVQIIDGNAYYVDTDGKTICSLQSCISQAADGNRYYFEDDSSLRHFAAGFTQLPEGMVYADTEGYILSNYVNQIVPLEGSLYAFDESGFLRWFEAGVQEAEGKQYLLSEAGFAIPLRQPGLLLEGGELYYVNEDGSLLTNSAQGYLTFGADGRYTSGNETLDQAVDTLLAASVPQDVTEPEEMLRAAYTYLRDNYRYLSMDLYDAGTTDWAEASALTFFDLTKGNCYCWAAALMYTARQLGYQAYVVAGWESNPTNVHAWTMIDWPDGETYLFDAQLEYAYWYMFSNKPQIDMFKASGDGTLYNGFAYYFP